MGAQADSRKESAPSFVFGSGDRSGAFVMAEGGGSKRNVGLSPGPIYLPSPRGVIGDGPKFTIGSFAANPEHRRAGAPPGPGEYEPPPNVGAEQALSTRRTSAKFGWGTGGRHKAPVGAIPRPGARSSIPPRVLFALDRV
jgi:hypothetical protein